jgi:hypothetical protein
LLARVVGAKRASLHAVGVVLRVPKHGEHNWTTPLRC